jgi:hypothetical protein
MKKLPGIMALASSQRQKEKAQGFRKLRQNPSPFRTRHMCPKMSPALMIGRE